MCKRNELCNIVQSFQFMPVESKLNKEPGKRKKNWDDFIRKHFYFIREHFYFIRKHFFLLEKTLSY